MLNPRGFRHGGLLKKRGSELNKEKTRSSLLGLVEFYLLYLAYELYQGRNDPNTTMTEGMAILFTVMFILAAAGLLIYAFREWKRSGQQEEEPPKDDQNSLK